MRPSPRTFLGHPAGLAVLFFTEAWERFSFYGLRTLLIYYLVKHLGMSQPAASQVYGTYVAAVYFTPLIGGYVADRWLGPRRAVAVGAVIMAAGHFLMAFEPLVLPALALVAIGNGAFKPAISAQVGALYAAEDPRRDAGYGLFYMGINLGGLFAPLVCGTVAAAFGWHWGFALAGVGMLIGLAIYALGQPLLAPVVKPPPAPVDREAAAIGDRRHVLALLVLAGIAVFFWTAVEQMGNTVALWIDSDVDRTVRLAGRAFEAPAIWFQSLNPLLVILLSPILAMLWSRGRKAGGEDATLSRMTLGCLFVAGAFAPLVMASGASTGGAADLLLALSFFVLLTIGELHVSPLGQSIFSKRAPVRHATLLMGVWFFAHTIGGYLAGYLGGFWGAVPKAWFFAGVGAVPLACGLTLLLLRSRLQRLLRDAPACATSPAQQ